MKLSDHFDLDEFLPAGYPGRVPPDVLQNLERLTGHLLERARTAMLDRPIRISSGWRAPEKNAAVHGVQHSDHLTGCAADCQVLDDEGQLDPAQTIKLFLWCVEQGDDVGQVILEDHRAHYKNAEKLWVHIAFPSAEHAARATVNRILISHQPGAYRPPMEGELA